MHSEELRLAMDAAATLSELLLTWLQTCRKLSGKAFLLKA